MNIPNGKYAFRFDGFAMSNTIPHRLVGVGVMTLEDGEVTGERKVTGEHRSTLCRLRGQDAAVEHSTYELKGTCKDDGDFGLATINFHETSPDDAPQSLDGTFVFAPAGAGRFWLISINATVAALQLRDVLADEIVSGEAVLLVDEGD